MLRALQLALYSCHVAETQACCCVCGTTNVRFERREATTIRFNAVGYLSHDVNAYLAHRCLIYPVDIQTAGTVDSVFCFCGWQDLVREIRT